MIVFYINPDSYIERRGNIESVALSLSNDVHRVAYNKKRPCIIETVCRAHLEAMEQILKYDRFPVLLLEDDATQMQPLPDREWPQCDIIYLGGSLCGDGTRIEDYNEDFYRVYNMLTFHSVIFTNREGVIKVQKDIQLALRNGCYNDVQIALSSEKNLYLTPKEGFYFYQKGLEHWTKFLWKDIKQ